LVKDDTTKKVAEVPSAGLVRIIDGFVDDLNLNSGHFKPGNEDMDLQDSALEAAWLAFDLCQAPFSPNLSLSHFRDSSE
ncbi:MAG TPA: hypothetical protein VF189_06040, partial [Patescibacteria group bacterium]